MEIQFTKQAVLTVKQLKQIVIEHIKEKQGVNAAISIEIAEDNSYGDEIYYSDLEEKNVKIIIREL